MSHMRFVCSKANGFDLAAGSCEKQIPEDIGMFLLCRYENWLAADDQQEQLKGLSEQCETELQEVGVRPSGC